MLSLNNKIIRVFILTGVFVCSSDVGGQRPPREMRDLRDRERVEERGSTFDKKSKLDRDFQESSFKNIERKMVDRTPPSRGGKPVGKGEKWLRGDLKKKFNDAVKPEKKDDGKKDGGGGNPPQTQPKPNLPSPGKRGF